MDERLSRIEASIRDLDRRLQTLERGDQLTGAAALEEPDEPVAPLVRRETATEAITLTGRTLVALGGAYLLRALSDSHVLPLPAGVALAFAYAALWLAAADRDGGRTRSTSASFHALVTGLVAFPLVWEATARFAILDRLISATALTAATLGMIAVAVHRRIQTIAWLALSLALPTTIALIASTGAPLPYTVCLVVFGVATLWVGYAWNWTWLRWPAALFADVAVIALAVRASGTDASAVVEPPLQVVAIQMLLLNGYLGSVAIRTIVRARDVIVFEVVQTAAALAVGFGGAVYVAQRSGSGVAALALLNLAFGIACYAVAFFFVRERPRNFSFYSTLALVLLITSGRLLLSPLWLTLAFDALALACTWTAARIGRVALMGHAAIYLAAAGVASHLWSSAAQALVGPAVSTWTPIEGPASVTLAVVAVCWWWPTTGRDTLRPHEWAPRVMIAVLLVASAAGWMVSVATPLLAGEPGQGADSGVIATIRTAALAVAAVALGRFGRDARFRESLWLVYPLLAAGGLKLLVEDFPQSKPATLFLALALYGGALIIAPRLTHRRA